MVHIKSVQFRDIVEFNINFADTMWTVMYTAILRNDLPP